MTNTPSSSDDAELVEPHTVLTLTELCETCQVEAEWIAELVEHGAVDPIVQTTSDWAFSHVTLIRVAKAKRLERDLSLNTPGIALALELLDEIENLRAQLKAADTAIERP